MLLICYYRVSQVLIENYAEKEDKFCKLVKDELEEGMSDGSISESMNDIAQTNAGLNTGGDISGCLTSIVIFVFSVLFLPVLALLFAPILICFKFAVNFVLVRRPVMPSEANVTNPPTNP